MANKEVKEFDNKVYIRKIRRNIAKNKVGSNRIKKYWEVYEQV